MRHVYMYMVGEMFYTRFYQVSEVMWEVSGRTLEPLEVVVDWLENGILPKHSSR